MKFNIGPIVWQAMLVSEPLYHQGRLCWGICNLQEHTIRVWDRADSRTRLFTLMHELTHAWVFSIGLPDDGDEALCNFTATLAAQFVLDLCNQSSQIGPFLTDPAQLPQSLSHG